MSAYATAVTEMTREDLIAELFRHKDAKDAAREEGRQAGLRQAAEIARAAAVTLRDSRAPGDAACGAIEAAIAIEARAKEKQP
jgi:hypothetical protein